MLALTQERFYGRLTKSPWNGCIQATRQNAYHDSTASIGFDR